MNMVTKRGRPKKRATEQRALRLTLRLTPIEYGRIKTAAKNKNMTMVKFIRECIKTYLDEFLDA